MYSVKRNTKSGLKIYTYEDKSLSRSKCKKEYNKRYYGRAGEYKPRAWSTEDEKEIMYSKLSDRELEVKLQRSIGAIQSRRWIINSEGRDWLDKDKVVLKASQPNWLNT